jgi:hypothetical protein
MSCRACQRLLQAHLDGAGPVDAGGLEQHLRQCPGCSTLFEAARRLSDGLRLLTPPSPPGGLTDRIVAGVLAERRQRVHRRRLRTWSRVALAVAACLLVALGVRTYWARPTPAGTGETARGERPAPPPPRPVVPPPPPAPPLRDSVAEAGSAVASLTSRTAGATFSETAALLPWGASLPELGEVDPMVEPPTRPFRAAGAGVSAGLGPVAESARRAVGLFLRDLPPMGLDADQPQNKAS